MNVIDDVAIAIFASDGQKIIHTSIDESWARSPELHVIYRERALVFIKVYGERMAQMADDEIERLGHSRRSAPAT